MDIDPGMDHIVTGYSRYHYRYPPVINQEEVDTFSDTILKTVPFKIAETQERMRELIRWRARQLERIDVVCADNEDLHMFLTEIVTAKFGEYPILEKWYWYWKNLQDIANPRKKHREPKGMTPDMVARAKQVPLQNLFTGTLRKFGNRHTGCCPFHEEKTPSFSIFENTNKFHCYGCGEHGDAIDFVMKLKNIKFNEAVQELL